MKFLDNKENRFYISLAFGTAIIVLLIVSVILLAIVLSRQNQENNTKNSGLITTHSITSIKTSVPFEQVKMIVTMLDTSVEVDPTTLNNEVYFVTSYLIESLKKNYVQKYPNYNYKFSAVGFSNHASSDNLKFVSLGDDDAIQELLNPLKTTTLNETLELKAPLQSIRNHLWSQSAQNPSIILMVSGRGNNYDAAVEEAKTTKELGYQLMVLSLTKNVTALQELASDNTALDATSIKANNTAGMNQLSKAVADETSPPASVTTVVTTSSTSTSASSSSTLSTKLTSATPSSLPTSISSPTKITTASTQVTTAPSDQYRIIILIDASSSISQEQIVQQSNFVYNNLVIELQKSDRQQSLIQVVPYAFDLSPDVENYTSLTNKSGLEAQYRGAKLSKITTFMSPLDRLFLGQTFIQLEKENSENFPSHIVTLISNKGNDYGNATNFVYYNKHRTQFITAVLNSNINDYANVSSTSADLIQADGIFKQQDLDMLAKKIALRIFQQTTEATLKSVKATKEQKNRMQQKPIATSESMISPLQLKHTVINSTDIVVLIDTSSDVNETLIKKQTDFVQFQLLTKLKNAFNDEQNKRIAIIPYASYCRAHVQEFVNIFDEVGVLKQVKVTQLAPMTIFRSPFNKLQIPPTLQLIIGSSLLSSVNAKIILMASGPGADIVNANTHINNIITAGRHVIIVALNGDTTKFRSLSILPTNVLNGNVVWNGDNKAESELAKRIVEQLELEQLGRMA